MIASLPKVWLRLWWPKSVTAVLLLMAFQNFSQPAFADHMSEFAKNLTPIGAEAAGDAESGIPAWQGGIERPDPAWGYKLGGPHPDPYASDQVIARITSDNASKNSKLTLVDARLLKEHPDSFALNVYPSHRSCGYPKKVYEAAAHNLKDARLVNGGNGVDGAEMGFPFPIPSNGLELIWNHNLAYRGYKVTHVEVGATPTKDGSFVLTKDRDRQIYPLGLVGAKSGASENMDLIWSRAFLEPSRTAGGGFLFYNTIDQVVSPRQGWMFNPQSQRVSKIPTIAYDSPMASSDGVRLIDTQFMFNGAPDRYDWVVLGKEKMYVPYNSYHLSSPSISYDEIIKPGHLNPDFIRYELHRVWIVEARLKIGSQHQYSRRVFYIDEDSWLIVASAIFNSNGRMIAGQHAYVKNYYEVPLCVIDSEVLYDFDNGRYDVRGLKNAEVKPNYFASELSASSLTPMDLRRTMR